MTGEYSRNSSALGMLVKFSSNPRSHRQMTREFLIFSTPSVRVSKPGNAVHDGSVLINACRVPWAR